LSDPVILACMQSIGKCSEAELRYQLRKRKHPLADSPKLLSVLAEMETEGLLSTELVVSLGEKACDR
jgi:hypothetical protein